MEDYTNSNENGDCGKQELINGTKTAWTLRILLSILRSKIGSTMLSKEGESQEKTQKMQETHSMQKMQRAQKNERNQEGTEPCGNTEPSKSSWTSLNTDLSSPSHPKKFGWTKITIEDAVSSTFKNRQMEGEISLWKKVLTASSSRN